MELIQQANQKLSALQLQSISLLQMTSAEIEQYLQKMAQENPMIELDLPEKPAPQIPLLADQMHRLAAKDISFHSQLGDAPESTDPLTYVGTAGGLEESLQNILLHQLMSKKLNPNTASLVKYLIYNLDDDGYLRTPLAELAHARHVPPKDIEAAAAILRSMEPVGIGAETLSQCLLLQLERLPPNPIARQIVEQHLEKLGRHHYQAIADQLQVPLKQVQQAVACIQQLHPRPGNLFTADTPLLYLRPDILVQEENGIYTAQICQEQLPRFRFSKYYQKLLLTTNDSETIDYLASKLQQAQHIQSALEQRKSTLLRCACAIVARQQAFFRHGFHALEPMRMSDLAQELNLHLSTVSRAIKGKYLQCSHGLIPLRSFFSGTASDSASGAAKSTAACKAALKSLILQEDICHPLSDEQLSALLKEHGYAASRRMVSKYRQELGIPSTLLRKNR